MLIMLILSVEDITSFLIESYGNTDSAILIYEVAEPHYVISASTGSPSSKYMLSEDLSKPCPVDSGERTGCEPVRIAVQDFGSRYPMDTVLVKAAELLGEKNYPQELLVVKVSNDMPIYVSQSTVYTQEGTELSWRVVVVEPGVESTTSALTLGNPYFIVVIVIAGLGCIICFWFVMAIYRRRSEKAIVYSDWRFTCAFIAGCIFFNSSSFTLLGENTKATCLLRMWSFHFFFVVALSPLFVKVWRMYTLVGSMNIRRNTITNVTAALYTLPMIAVQTIILLIFTFVDPPRPMDDIDQEGGSVTYGVVCNSDTNAYAYTLSIYEALCVFVGCVLAYKSRNMSDDFGEAKQMIFSMYNIFFVGLITIVVVKLTGLQTNERSVLQAVGVFWGTVVAAGAFVIPRLLLAKEYRQERQEGVNRNIHLTGIQAPSPPNQSFDTGVNSRMSSALEPIEESWKEDLDSEPFGPSEGVCVDCMETDSESAEQAPTPPSSFRTRVDFTGTLREIEN